LQGRRAAFRVRRDGSEIYANTFTMTTTAALDLDIVGTFATCVQHGDIHRVNLLLCRCRQRPHLLQELTYAGPLPSRRSLEAGVVAQDAPRTQRGAHREGRRGESQEKSRTGWLS
jgi:hypothetical protein